MKLLWKGKAYDARYDGKRLTVTPEGGKPSVTEVRIQGTSAITPGGGFPFTVAKDRGGIWVHAAGCTAYLEHPRPEAAESRSSSEVRSPMTGRVVALSAKEGSAVRKGEVLAVVTAMKMEFRVESPRDGAILTVSCREGEMVDLGRILVRLKEES